MIINYVPESDKIVHEARVDFGGQRVDLKQIHIVQYDKTLPIIAISLYENGYKYTLPDIANCKIRWGKLDGTFVYKDVVGCNPERNIVYVEVDYQMTTVYGDINPILELIIAGSSVGSSPLELTIDRNPIQDGDIESAVEMPLAAVALTGDFYDLLNRPVFEEYAKKEYVDNAIKAIDLTTYASKEYVDEAIQNIDTTKYATRDYVNSSISALNIGQYAKSSELAKAIQDLNITSYAKKTDLSKAIADLHIDDYATLEYVNQHDLALSSLIDEKLNSANTYTNEQISALGINNYAKKSYVDSAIAALELAKYATKEYVDDEIAKIHLDDYATLQNLNDAILNLNIDQYAKKTDLREYAKKTYVDDEIAKIDISNFVTTSQLSKAIQDLNISQYATKTYAETLVNNLNISQYATKTEVALSITSAISDLDINSYAKKTYVDDAINNIGISNYATKSYVNDAIAGIDLSKYALLSDLESFRMELSQVAFTGSYNDLTDKPTIPEAVTEATVAGWGFTKNVGTVTGVKINNVVGSITNGIVDLGTGWATTEAVMTLIRNLHISDYAKKEYVDSSMETKQNKIQIIDLRGV